MATFLAAASDAVTRGNRKNRLASAIFGWALMVSIAGLVESGENTQGGSASAVTATNLRVPQDFTTIQAAIEAAPDGGTILVSPGVYREPLRIGGKSVVLASRYLISGDQADVRRTVLDGSSTPSNPDMDNDDDLRRPALILVAADAGPATAIVGLTIRDADDGIACHGPASIRHNRFVNNVDAIDLDLSTAVAIEGNLIRDNDDDGIEIRLHEHQGELLEIVIRNNVITGNGEDGIQIIDYPDVSARSILIERNVIADNAMAAVGCMADGNMLENYEGASIPEKLRITHNTIVGNQYGIVGGDNAVVANNIFALHQQAALRRVDGGSLLSHNIFWSNSSTGKEP